MIQFKSGQIANSFYESHQTVRWDPRLARASIQICQDLFFHRELLKDNLEGVQIEKKPVFVRTKT